jgi:Tfp pilus assembly protein PilO
MPALPLDEAGKWVAAAYLVFVALLLVYIAVMAARLVRIQRELEEIARLADDEEGARESATGDPGVAPDPSHARR